MTGRTISHYRILEKLGEGGMGVVYKARDLELGRFVAVKTLGAEALADDTHRKRFLQEARAASVLNHPNIVTIYEIVHAEGMDCIVMEYVDGKPLQALMSPQGVPLKEAVAYGVQIAAALSVAHDAGIIHRDVKPANILVSASGTVKVADFGLAKLAESSGADENAPTRSLVEKTRSGAILGTVAYMSPEQAQGERLDARTDLFSFGVVLYEMLTGRRPFQGDSAISTLLAIIHDHAPRPHTLRPEIPPELERIVDRALRKERQARYASASELARDLTSFQLTLSSGAIRVADLVGRLRRPRVAAVTLLVLLVLAGASVWLFHRYHRTRWAKEQAIPQVARLIAEGKYIGAFDLATAAEPYARSDPRLARLWPEMSRTISVRTDPSGAEVYIKEYGAREDPWRHLGRSPIEQQRVPSGYVHWRLEKPGFETSYAAQPTWAYVEFDFNLHRAGDIPPGMVAVPRQQGLSLSIAFLQVLGPFDLDHFLIDRFEVTNREFKRFVDAGGYQEPKYWKEPFRQDNRTLSWEEAIRQFRDSTGRPAPSTWEAGTYPSGQDDFPVSGVSWYEAAAYAEFAGKKLPTIAHWYRAAEPRAAFYIVQVSNFGGKGPARVGQYQGVGPFGTYDMAGNVKEWCWNEADDARHYLLGGAWSDPLYGFGDPDARSPWDRSAVNGLRCVRYTSPVPAEAMAPQPRQFRDYSKEKPVGEEVFRAYASLYAYDPVDLQASVDGVDDTSPDWRRENVSFRAAYGSERVPALLFLPKNVRPPFQTILYHPGGGARERASTDNLDGFARVDFIIRSGRAVLYPVVLGTYQRRLPPAPAATPLEQRTRIIQRVQDVRRAFDYLETRPDIDRSRLAYCGASWGAAWGPVMVALESRAKAALFYDGGFYLRPFAPETDALNFAPQVKVPVLMINGRHDFIFPLETSQAPMFRSLGSPEKDKRHVVLETAHDTMVLRKDVVREVLDWLDKHLGPVQR